MKVRIWGCRGSLAAPGPDTVRYGGNTSCVEVRGTNGEVLVLDAGTGMRPLGVLMADEELQPVHVLLSHLHLDHLQGLGFFRPLFQAGREIHIWGPSSPVQSLADRIATYLSPPLFPVRLSDVPSKVYFHDVPDETVSVGGFDIHAELVTHQGPTVGYRIEENGRSVAYMPDHEPGLGVGIQGRSAEWISGYDLACRADVLLHDAQYTDEEYALHVGWGHSAVGHVVDFAKKAEVKHLVLFHHDPYHPDNELASLVTTAREVWGPSEGQVSAAWEGMTIELTPEGVTVY
jgi:phosphoribosyl 1,2-cyclic phosphodiesterase